MDGFDALKISDIKKKYIVDLLNPALEEMVAECIHRMPSDPVPFMLEFLEAKKVAEEERRLTPEERKRLLEENEKLHDQISKVKTHMKETVKVIASDASKRNSVPDPPEESEEESEGDDDEPEDFMPVVSTKSRTSVSAEVFGEWNIKKEFVAPFTTKTDDQKDRLRRSLAASWIFDRLGENEINIITGAMRQRTCEEGQRLINQGDEGDFLFVVETGSLHCFVKNTDNDDETKVYTYMPGEIFGELALLYNCPRQASIVVAEEACSLWELDRETFNHIVKEAAQKKRARHDAFLSKVALLSHMSVDERSLIADALKLEVYEKGENIVTAGEEGNKFYIVEEGEAEVLKDGVNVMHYKSGDVFGELALIKHQPRAATVTCATSCKVLSLDSSSFKRLFHIENFIERLELYNH